METGENKEMETETEDALDPSSECTYQGEEHQLFLQLEPEALDITDRESQHSDQQDDKTTKTDEEKTEITTSSNFAQSMTPVLTIALIGGTDSMEIESGNLLLGQDDLPAAELSQIAPRMYDLSGRCVSVINMLGLQSSELTQENHIGPLVHKQGINAVLLLLPLGQHIDEFKMGVGWLERMLGEGALAFTIIVFTHKNDQDFGLGDLKDNNDLMDLTEMCGNRYLTCKKSMNDPTEISTLLEQIDLMVSENDPCCYTGEMYDEEIRKQQLKTDWGDRSQSEEKTASVPDDLPEDGVANKEKGEEKILEEIGGSLIEKNIPENIQLAKVAELMCRLHLQDKYQDKLTTADFLNIGSSAQHQHEPQTENKLAHTFLQRLLMLDYRARYIPVRDENSEMHDTNDNRNDNAETEESAFDALFNKNTVSGDLKRNTHVHPMDVQMAVFHCSDSFLRQFMVTKLSLCQYALPLLVPNPFTKEIECPLWTFRQIRKTWKSTNDSNIVTSQSMPIYKAETPMVSFFRLGSVSSSKSQLMSNLINQRHSTFFHRHCPGSSKTCLLMDGVVEIAWYCPAGKPNDIFTDCVAFCNLHGDAIAKEIQRDRLIEKASVNVILLPSLGKGDKSMAIVQELFKSSKPLICLLTEEDSVATEIKKGKYKMGLRDRNQSDVSEELKRIIRNNLSRPCCSFKLEDMAEYSGFRVDEDDEDCQVGKTNALQITDLLKEMELSKIKEEFLPCQGRLWHNWCQKNKDLYRLQGNLEMERSKIQHEMMQIRHHQHQVAFTELMQMFITSLRSLGEKEKSYFLKWVGILLDDLSSDELSDLHHKYDVKWSEVLALKKKHDKSEQLKMRQMELEEISEKLQAATFGFEHILREMGQIYEAHASVARQSKGESEVTVSYLPELAAELMISGHPMELMDGDAAHVPLTWINGVLDEVIKKLGDQRVFVLSILGIQSTGKSTMLNAMFGLQFAVSAGRCTRGAFMQLVKVTEEMKDDFRFDYVLVVDTEGLRALELAGKATVHHDNELATFVIGLGNMTLINIFGENPAEMQDIIQIAVQAFMRMKKVNLSPSCVFVHQNVGDITAGEKNMEGKRRLQDKLDEMTQLAAKEEDSNAECFSDVIAFDIQRDVKYFSQLWEGSPPMAPPNPCYSENVQELRKTILSKTSKSFGMTLSQFKSSIQDLWNALLNENFVFSFKNTLEIAVYRKLEIQYGKWIWALRSAMLTIENQLHNRIENGKLHRVERHYLVEEMRKTREEVDKSMKKYFDEDRDKEMLIQWRGRFQTKMCEFDDELVKGAKRKLEEVIQQRDARKKLDDKKTQYENKLFQKSKELASKLKDKAKDEKQLENEFNTLWGVWVAELTNDTPSIMDINILDDVTCILGEIGNELSLVHDRKSCGMYREICTLGSYSNYAIVSKHQDLFNDDRHSRDAQRKPNKDQLQKNNVWGAFKSFLGFKSPENKTIDHIGPSNILTYTDHELIRAFTNDVDKQSQKIIETKPIEKMGYNDSYMQEIATHVKESVKEFESKFRKYAFKKEFTIDLSLYVCELAGSKLADSHSKFRSNNDALTYLEQKRPQYNKIFKSYCKGSTSAAVLGEFICNTLKESIVQAVYDQTAIDLAGEMQSSHPPFSGNRSNMEKHILISLVEKENFDKFMTYIHNPRKHFEKFIREDVEKYMLTERSKVLALIEGNITAKEQRVSHAVHTATKTVKNRNGDTNMWLRELSSALKDELKFAENHFSDFCDITDFDFLEEEVRKDLANRIIEINRGLSNVSLLDMKQFRERPDEILIKHFCDCCWVQCPFCKAICTNTMEGHKPIDHNVPFHRPIGIIGMHFRYTVEFSIDFCTTSVSSNGRFYPSHESEDTYLWKEYRKAGPRFADWSITPDLSELPYWKWFVCRFQKDLERYYDLKFQGRGEIPIEWRKFTKEQAIESLK
ncbi:interferon-induced very large GTPase 1 isoform X1 [Oncorhynchus mykiss]|uniref:VLIG-type G domain-containing protein n=2 Tax=Oncorhynchus mykiss TaxID=8022 RepID=A0A8C7PFA8_ONCMY|nr:interferon-induced very large GTPase 1 isoform X1 [Oncorhynchus mykiss]XP_036798321.1 interferon-induced very large GTPase 1 isoform X1 [Oncorhynchus mykiss]XP_036798322.1 interferon-induced very large GTPase 1 isoform X1 [Oncorhynchus mykiss]